MTSWLCKRWGQAEQEQVTQGPTRALLLPSHPCPGEGPVAWGHGVPGLCVVSPR